MAAYPAWADGGPSQGVCVRRDGYAVFISAVLPLELRPDGASAGTDGAVRMPQAASVREIVRKLRVAHPCGIVPKAARKRRMPVSVNKSRS